ncbi:Eukaryotic translation elongation factor 1 epsilon-1 [Paramuricea clavata]|nr:Eukaryotic translation elongation factor 1 epsilon-1 [Paramuricea clavata]
MAAAVIHSCGNSAVEIVYKSCKPDSNKLCMKRDKSDVKCKEPYITLTNGFTARGITTTIKAIARISECNLLGQDILQEAEVDQWMEYCLTKINPCCEDKTEIKDIIKLLNSFLVDRAFFVGNSLTTADLLIFSTLFDVYNTLTIQEKERYIHVSRWFQEVQNICCTTDKSRTKVVFLRNLLY